MDYENKYYRIYAEIDLDAIKENALELKESLNIDTKMFAIIKADAYGHGAIPVAWALEEVVDFFGVATIDEALLLIKHNIKKPVHIIGFTHESRLLESIEEKIRLTVYDLETARKISDLASSENPAYIHIKIDTGMNRIGFSYKDKNLINIIKEIYKMPNLIVEGIFTHFYNADSYNKEDSLKQIEIFKEITEKLELEGIHIALKHTSNSAGIIELKEAGFNAARAGIALYGLYPSDEVEKNKIKLKAAMTLKSHIIHLKEVDEGEGISYGPIFRANKKMKVATIPVGYGDGYPRNLSDKGYVLINNTKCNILGRICMDQFMVDVSHLENVRNGDEVILLGKQGDYEIIVEELAKISGRFHYEFICDLSKRIPRIYKIDEKIICEKDYFSDSFTLFD